LYKTGLVIGKFLPPHRGHKLLIETACAQAEKVTVIVCDRVDQQIPGRLRAAWLRELHPSVEVKITEDDLDPNDSRGWAERTVACLGHPPDAVFTSESYGEVYAGYLGATHVSVDPERRRVPCSGHAILDDPFAGWSFLEPCVRAHFVRRIAVVGAESTGTTTMARALAAHYATTWVPEYGRTYAEEKQRRFGQARWRTDEFVHIATEQARWEDQAARLAFRVLVCDTDPLATAIWHERYVGCRSPQVEAIGANRSYSLYLLTDIDVAFVQDGTRDGEELRGWMHRRFQDELERRARPYVVLSGSHEQRLRRAVNEVDRLLTGGSR
jgi:NadR type nicotinamide-nucleotide adenylyltransferase